MTRVFPLTDISALRKLSLVMLNVLRSEATSLFLQSISASMICSTETNSSFILPAISSAEVRTLSPSADIPILLLLPLPVIFGSPPIFLSTSPSKISASTFILLRSCGIRPFSCLRSPARRCTGSITLLDCITAILCAFLTASTVLCVYFSAFILFPSCNFHFYP